jgi:L-alanine-DL-glutamate epimerase-like enolase superfamily enzyme
VTALTTEPMRIENGHAIPSDAPGLGIAWDWKAIEQQAVAGSAFTVK